MFPLCFPYVLEQFSFFTLNSVYVLESVQVYNLSVLRTKGTFGAVKVNYYVEKGSASKDDFNIPDNPGGESTLQFADGQSEQNITVYIVDDPYAEGDETFQVILKSESVQGGAALGRPSSVQVIIRASDSAHGEFNLSSLSVSKSISEPGSGADNEAEFRIDRNGATFGTVVVGWKVVNASALDDLRPVSGNISFDAGETKATFKIQALLDSTPEKAETFVIKLSIISGELSILSLFHGLVLYETPSDHARA